MTPDQLRELADAQPIGYVTANGLRMLIQDEATVMLYRHDYLIRPDHIPLYTHPAPDVPQAEPKRDPLAADLAWLADYLPAHYPIGQPDAGGRICIGGSCGATFAEAVHKARLAFDVALANSIMRDILGGSDAE